MIRAVLDTNVFVSGILSPSGTPATLIRLAAARRFVVVTTEPLLDELREALDYPKVAQLHRLSQDERRRWVQGLGLVADVVTPLTRATVVKRDSDDDALFEAAIAGRASVIVTGDKAVLAIGSYEGISVVTPRIFLDALADPSLGNV